MSQRIIGIDLGTTASVVSVMEAGKPKLISDSAGQTTFPSLVVVKNDGSITVGHEAEREAKKYSESNLVVTSLKRSLEMSREYEWCDIKMPVQVLMAMVLAELRVQAEVYLGGEINSAVIAVPANFNFLQRQFTKEAALIAGLQPIRIVNEATASVCAMRDSFQGAVVAADLGGGTFDVSAIDFGGGVFEVLAASGDDRLGGDDFTAIITRLILQKLDTSRFDPQYLQTDRITAQRLRDASEDAKRQLSSIETASVSIPYIRTYRRSYETLSCNIARSEFEKEAQSLFSRIDKIIAEVWAAARFDKPPPISQAKGAVTIPASKKKSWWSKLFRKAAKPAPTPYIPTRPSSFPRQSHISGLWLIGNASKMPFLDMTLRRKYKMLRPPGLLDLKTPVALGAAKIAGMLQGTSKDTLLLDATPSSLGIEIGDKEFARIIRKNETIPTQHTQTFTTTCDNQTVISVKIFEGEHDSTQFNKLLTTLKIENILPARAGVPKIEILFHVDANGLLRVSAKDLATQKVTAILCNDFVLPEKEINDYHQLVQRWIRRRRAEVTGLAQEARS
jgi:molecular chaperone DnaK